MRACMNITRRYLAFTGINHWG
uniref:Uncharacterized protein n=1 Tax=Anguilla anguilla TaxID=7936 RepID=A0A0E9THF5_ANGAN